MPFCSLRPVWVEAAGETVQHIYIIYESREPDQELMHDWIQKNFPDHEALTPGKHYVMRDTKDFEFAFKLTWS